MSVYMRGYDRGQQRGRAEVGLSGDHAPSDAVKSLPGLVMMVGKLVMKLSGIFPGQLHPELALGVQTRLQATRQDDQQCDEEHAEQPRIGSSVCTRRATHVSESETLGVGHGCFRVHGAQRMVRSSGSQVTLKPSRVVHAGTPSREAGR